MTVYNKFNNESTSKKASLVEAQNPNFKDPYYISKRGIVLSIVIPLGLLISVLLLHHIYAKMFRFEHRQYDHIIIDDGKVLTMDQAMDFEIWAQKFAKHYATIEEHNKRKAVFEEHVAKMIEHNKKHDNGDVGHRRGLNQFSDLTSEEFLHRNHGNKTGHFFFLSEFNSSEF